LSLLEQFTAGEITADEMARRTDRIMAERDRCLDLLVIAAKAQQNLSGPTPPTALPAM